MGAAEAAKLAAELDAVADKNGVTAGKPELAEGDGERERDAVAAAVEVFEAIEETDGVAEGDAEMEEEADGMIRLKAVLVQVLPALIPGLIILG